jgi:hypothetical protein
MGEAISTVASSAGPIVAVVTTGTWGTSPGQGTLVKTGGAGGRASVIAHASVRPSPSKESGVMTTGRSGT